MNQKRQDNSWFLHKSSWKCVFSFMNKNPMETQSHCIIECQAPFNIHNHSYFGERYLYEHSSHWTSTWWKMYFHSTCTSVLARIYLNFVNIFILVTLFTAIKYLICSQKWIWTHHFSTDSLPQHNIPIALCGTDLVNEESVAGIISNKRIIFNIPTASGLLPLRHRRIQWACPLPRTLMLFTSVNISQETAWNATVKSSSFKLFLGNR